MPVVLVVKNASKIRSASLASMPTPESSTVTLDKKLHRSARLFASVSKRNN